MAVCRVSGCNQQPSHWAVYCNAHKSRDRRHGDPQQQGITKAHLAPYVVAVKRIIERNKDNAAWAKLDCAWLNVVTECKAAVDYVEREGHVTIGWQHSANAEVLKIALAVPPRVVVETALALYLMAEQAPKRFRGNRGFMFQLARRVRHLTEANVGITYDYKQRRTKRVYRDLAPAATEHMAALIVEALGAAGLYIAKQETVKVETRAHGRQELGHALKDIR